MSDLKRPGVGVGVLSEDEGVGLVWIVPNERYWSLLGMEGGRRVRSSGGRDASLGRGTDGGRGYGRDDWLLISRFCSRCWRFWVVKAL